ncbi:MAG: PadR family transcriptional regulator [Bacteroidales bacterium]|jgi:PadR family transcriptional regulator PadR|nr:PadR family transcriptional regulator [Bacteroidales bacterium]
MNVANAKAQMRKGVLEYCILSVLSESDAYPSDIIRRLKEVRMMVVEGTLYPLLMRQKNAGWLSYRWEESTQGPPRKYYSITPAGRLFLHELDASWNELVDSVHHLRQRTDNKPSITINNHQ